MKAHLVSVEIMPQTPRLTFEIKPPFTSKRLLIHGQEIILTPRESDCLACLAQGKTAKESGKILGISQRTVEAYLDNLKMKAKVKHKSGLLIGLL